LEGVVETDADDAPYLQAVYSLVDRRTIFLLLRDALFIVLGFALVTTGILLTLALGGSRSKSRAGRSGPSTAAWPMPGTDDPLETAEQSGESGGVSEPPSPFEAAPEAAPSSEPAPEARRESGPAAQAEPEPAPSSEPAPAPEGLSASEAERGDEAPEHVPELERVEGLDEGSEPADTGGPRGAREADGLFSARTGLSYRSHLDHRLQQEVERAAYNEEDVCVALLSFPGLMATDEDYRKIAQGMLDTFRFPELLFEFTDDTFCVILPNTDLDHGIRRVGDFAKDYPQLASHTGLSSRNGRLVEGKRLLMEAERARQKAEAEGELIIGFRPDPDRYRSYLTSAD
jgi:GGDEF domain-containing protein